MKKTIADYTITTERDHEQYWQGHGISYTTWENCATGSGSTEKEALEDALDQMAQEDITISEDLENDVKKADNKDVEDREDFYFYVSVDYNLAK